MDEIVKAALKKWPNVPACRGWLALDARGDWYMRDERIQAAGPFPEVKGSRITHDKLKDFIHRNYAADAQGAWFFQNGPQRVYVELEAAPWVWRLQPDPGGPVLICAHTGAPARYESAWLDEHGRLFLHTDLGFGVVHTLDMEAASHAVEAGLWQPEDGRFDSFPGRFGYVLSPQQQTL
ncbi:DUF2946 family protein [Aquabacterium sp. A7-Y]|uniref:DUF2946 family protein n=1 Tax=Aquabacterium sp. A7-Y TaxID=1349605 RepID=UPI00223E673B|nr:DUF2946 family protein [Aquabacterium sp. A7-Y]MCW7540021.1 DUF2946 family protein [Aquabacterium sp. A7-Y]